MMGLNPERRGLALRIIHDAGGSINEEVLLIALRRTGFGALSLEDVRADIDWLRHADFVRTQTEGEIISSPIIVISITRMGKEFLSGHGKSLPGISRLER